MVTIVSFFFFFDSNYDRRYIKHRHWASLMDLLPDPKEHPYGPNNPQVLPQ